MQVNIEQESETSSKELNALFKNRWHGAVNIRGIRYQILYSVLRALDLYKKEGIDSCLRLEGIEDVDILDLVGLRYKDEYVQVKSADKPWKWSQLKEPLAGFLKVSRTDPDCRFVLAVNFSLTKDIEKLSLLESLSKNEKKRIKNNFRQLCRKLGGSSEEADDLLGRLSIISLSEDKIWKLLRVNITEAFSLGSEAVNTYIAALVAKFLDWAKERKTIRHFDLENVRANIGEALARETEFQAYGRGLIDRVLWKPDQRITDFFEGKGTRPGHIVAGFDIKRTNWLEKIEAALNTSKVCVLRASSGQGKSTLMYQYAYEKWSRENIFILRVAKSSEQVELVRNYLQFRAGLGLPVLLLIDNIGWSTQLWSSIAQECTALGIRVLITVRDEDWQRFAQESLTSYEILEPSLDFEEACQIYQVLHAEGRIHTSVDSPEWAYEKIGDSHLLMEYVYLLTQGRMLEERLRDQIKQFSQQQEDPAKVEILRRTALAEALGTPVVVDKLLSGISLNSDPQQVLQSLCGEYLKLEGKLIMGLHWVRSNCLAQILHQDYPNPAITALAILDAIPSANLSTFVSNALCWQGLDVEIFLKGLANKTKNSALDTTLTFLDGVFEAGERKFFEANRNLFDEAYEYLGTSGIFWLGMDCLPIVSASDNFSNLINSLGDKAVNLQKIREISSKVNKTFRGIDLCINFLSQICLDIQANTLLNDLKNTGRLLDWLALCELKISAWQSIKDSFLSDTKILSLSLEDFCSLAQGVYRYDGYIYRRWFSLNKEDILGYLKLHTDCIELKIEDENNIVIIEFFVDEESEESPNKQAMFRLDKLRSALPFCDRYQSQGIWSLPSNLQPSVDNTRKDRPKENLSFESDLNKNIVWRRIAQIHYLPDSYFQYEKGWYTLRCHAFNFVKNLASELKKVLAGKEDDPGLIYGKHFERLIEIEDSCKFAFSSSIASIEPLNINIAESLKAILRANKPGEWLVSFRHFHTQLFEYHRGEFQDKRIGELAVRNFSDTVKNLHQMHTAFAQLFLKAPDYFNASELNSKEVKVYSELFDLLEIFILEQPGYYLKDITQYIQKNKDFKRKNLLRRFKDTLAPLREKNISLVFPHDIYVDYPLRCLPLAFSVKDPNRIESELFVVLAAIAQNRSIVDYYYLISTHQNKRFLDSGYKLSSYELSQLEKGNLESWESLVPRKIPENILNCLPPLPFEPNPEQQFKAIIDKLLFSVERITKYEQRIQILKKSQNDFEIKLYERHKEKLNKLKCNLKIELPQVKIKLKRDFSILKTEVKYRSLWEILENLGQALQENKVGK